MKDKIIDDIHKTREDIAKEFDYNIRKLLEAARKKQSKSDHPVVSLQTTRQKSAGRGTKKVA